VTIEVSKETRDNLKKMKEDEDLRNMDAVVRELLGKSLRALKAVVAIHGVESEDIEEDEDDGKRLCRRRCSLLN
jgi:predicted CopG family antitoxin